MNDSVFEKVIVHDLATTGDYEVLKRLSVGKKCVFEFGSFIGGSAVAMLPQIKEAGGRLYCVDHFLGNQDDPHTKAVPRDLMVATLLQRIDPCRDIVTVLIGETKEALLFPTGIADMVFIDASHSYKAVVADIRVALHLIKGGGIVCGHDYIKHYEDCDKKLLEEYANTPDGGYGGVGYGVIKAVHDFFGRPQHEAAVWWVTIHKGGSSKLLAHCKEPILV